MAIAKKVEKNEPLYINGKYVAKSTQPLYKVKHPKGSSPYKLTDKKVEVTLVKSTIACLAIHKATVKALGLHRIGETKVLPDNDATRGMIFRVKHLVQVKEI